MLAGNGSEFPGCCRSGWLWYCCWKPCVPGSTRACVNNEHFSLFTFIAVVMSPLYNCIFRWNDRYRASRGMWGLWLGCARLCGLELFVERVSGHSRVKRLTGSKGAGCQMCLRLCERHFPLLRAMDEIVYGTIWRMICPLLTTDDVMRWQDRDESVECG